MTEQDYGTNHLMTPPNSDSLTPGEQAAVLRFSPAGLCIINGRIIQWANPAFYQMLGISPGTLESRDAADLYPTPREFFRVARRLTTQVAQQGTGLADTRLLRADGTAFDCRVRASRLAPRDSDSPLVLVATDITEIKSRQTQGQQAQKMDAIGVLAGGISHDFNNLLMGVQGHLSLMRINVADPEKVAAHIQQIAMLVETAADLTARLLGFARGGKYQISVLDINQVVSVALNIFCPAHRDIEIDQRLYPGPLSVDGDHSQLEQVVLNLLVNGAQSMVDEGKITLTTGPVHVGEGHDFPFEVAPGDYVQIGVKDEGIGMDEETRKKVFDPFFSTKEIGDRKGRGLGLSTVYGIVKNHGGFITVDSTRGEGSEFRVCLPCSKQTPEEAPSPEEKPLAQMPRGSETILFVDDEEEILNLGRNFLEKLGYKTMLARNGLEAVEIFKRYSNEISLVVLDLIMPVMDGKQAFFEMQKIAPGVKMLVSTGFHVDEDVETLLSQGCHGFLQKPFSMHRFSRVLREILDGTEKPAPGK